MRRDRWTWLGLSAEGLPGRAALLVASLRGGQRDELLISRTETSGCHVPSATNIFRPVYDINDLARGRGVAGVIICFVFDEVWMTFILGIFEPVTMRRDVVEVVHVWSIRNNGPLFYHSSLLSFRETMLSGLFCFVILFNASCTVKKNTRERLRELSGFITTIIKVERLTSSFALLVLNNLHIFAFFFLL